MFGKIVKFGPRYYTVVANVTMKILSINNEDALARVIYHVVNPESITLHRSLRIFFSELMNEIAFCSHKFDKIKLTNKPGVA